MTFFPDSSTFIQIGTLEIKWYAILILIGAFAAYYLMSQQFKKMGYEQDDADNIFIGCLLFGVIGARIWYVLFSDLQSYLADPITIIEIWNGGLAIHGGLIAGIIFAYLYAKKHKLSFFRISDGVLPYVLIAQAIGRWGNFINQEAFGGVVSNPALQFFPFAVYIDALNEWHQATFFYESFGNAILLTITLLLSRKQPKDGTLLATYFIGYGLIRVIVEGFRTDSLYLVGSIRVSQLLSGILILVGIALLVLIRKGVLQSKPYNGKYCVASPNDEQPA